MKQLKYVLAGLLTIPAIYILLFMIFYLPSTRKVQITGTEVKRMEAEPSEEGGALSRDVRFILTRDPITGETYVFRNEDTRWGWPPYFKFNSGDLGGDAASIKETQPNATVLITYYGWRIPMLDMYPNAASLEIVDPRYIHFPWFNLVFLLFLFGSGGIGVWWGRRRVKRWKQARGGKVFARKKKESLTEPEAPPADPKSAGDEPEPADSPAPEDASGAEAAAETDEGNKDTPTA